MANEAVTLPLDEEFSVEQHDRVSEDGSGTNYRWWLLQNGVPVSFISASYNPDSDDYEIEEIETHRHYLRQGLHKKLRTAVESTIGQKLLSSGVYSAEGLAVARALGNAKANESAMTITTYPYVLSWEYRLVYGMSYTEFEENSEAFESEDYLLELFNNAEADYTTAEWAAD